MNRTPTPPTPIKLAILLSGRTQRDIAREIGVSDVTLSRICTSGHATQSNRDALAAILRRDVSEIFPPREDLSTRPLEDVA